MSQSPSSRRLAVRRGSVSAPDPLGKNAAVNYDSNRSSSSRLTIVRVVDPSAAAPPNLSDSPSSPVHSRRSLRRHGSTSGSSSTDNRLSFAFSSFSPVSPPQPTSPLSSSSPQIHSSRTNTCSPSSSPRLRPSSPQFARRNSASGGSTFLKPNLTPEQLVDLARQSSAPRYVPSTSGAPYSSNTSNPDVTAASISSPATFTLLPVDVYLPFIDRAAETAHLLSTPPTKKLFSLLAQTFPTQADAEMQDPFAIDPARWTFDTLRRWLTEVDRPSANDAVWVRQARKCVLAHSELIWERLKGALGVPPELELEEHLDTPHFIDPSDSALDLSLPEDERVPDVSDHSHQSPDSVVLASSPETSLTIEPILATSSSVPAPSTPGVSNPPPSSLLAGLSHSHSASKSQVDQVLQDIVEDREEEEEDLGVDNGDEDRVKSEDDYKAQIHGLRVCTSPISSSAVTPHVFSYPPSPITSMNVSGRNSVEPRSPDFSQPPLTRRLSRTSSHGSVTSLGRPLSGWGIRQATCRFTF